MGGRSTRGTNGGRPAAGERAPERPAAASPPQPADGVLGLQRLVGNRGFAGLLARQAQTAPSLPPMPLTNDPLTGTTQGDLGPRPSRTQIAFGAVGDDVAFLQGRLNQDGAQPPVPVTGSFRAETDAAVREFQRRHGLKVDGIVGPQTWGLLDELARAGIAGPHDVMAPTQAVTQAEATAIAGEMGTAAPTGPQMVVAGYQQEMFAALDAYYDRNLAALLPTPITSMGHAGRIRDVAQRLVDDFYSDHIVMASRAGNLQDFHPGSQFRIGDASNRRVDPAFARAWVALDMLPAPPPSNGQPIPGMVSAAHHVDTRRARDRDRVQRVADRYLQSGRMQKVVDFIRSYAAEASSGTVLLGLRSRDWLEEGSTGVPTRRQLRRAMWDLLSGLMHEYLHVVTHEHFSATAERMGGQARRVLLEGFCDYFRKQAWDALVPRFRSDAGLRREVEGPYGVDANGVQLPADADVIVPHSYYDELAAATNIVAALGGGRRAEANARAAYFMGHVELLGIGPRTAGEQPAGALGTFDPGDAASDDLYVVRPGGEPVMEIFERTGSTRVRVDGGLFLGPAAGRIPAGTRLRVTGIRHFRATTNDTRGQVAAQNGISQRALERANHWAPAASNTRVPPGTRILIPAH